jgi:hypothetical protein
MAHYSFTKGIQSTYSVLGAGSTTVIQTGKGAHSLMCLVYWFSTKSSFALPASLGDIWEVLEKFLFVTTVGVVLTSGE